MDQSMVDFERENVERLPDASPSLPHPQLVMDDASKEANLSRAKDSSPPIHPPSAAINLVSSAQSEAPATWLIVTFANVDAAEQWRNNVQPPSLTDEEEGVRMLS
jgi:hypothetical protein